MIVYALSDQDYEGDQLVGIFSTPELAMAAREEMHNKVNPSRPWSLKWEKKDGYWETTPSWYSRVDEVEVDKVGT